MAPSPPFVDHGTNTLDTDQILAEAVPLATLVLLFVAVAVVPFAFVFLLGVPSPLGTLLALVGQFVLAVGAGIVLMYVVARGIQLADSGAAPRPDE